MQKYKIRKWYSYKSIPPKNKRLVIMTDMGYVFEAYYEDDGYHKSNVINGKVYFPREDSQESIVRWMIF